LASSYAFLTSGTLLAPRSQPDRDGNKTKVDAMDPKICLSFLLVGLIIGFSYIDEASAFLRKYQFARWRRRIAHSVARKS
jgi:hypothetical protein